MIRVAMLVVPKVSPKISATRSHSKRATRPQISAPTITRTSASTCSPFIELSPSSIAGWTSRRRTRAWLNQVALAGAGWHEDSVDRVDHTVRCGDVGDDYLRVPV